MLSPEVNFFDEFIIGKEFWHVDSYFLVQKDRPVVEEELIRRGIDWEDYYKLSPEERREIGWKERRARGGYFTFPKGKLILAHTKENIRVPTDRLFWMKSTFEGYPSLLTNVSAPLIHPGSKGPQTYEIVNMGGFDLRLKIKDLSCRVDIYPLDSRDTANSRSSGFSVQKRGRILLGNLS